MLSAISTVSNSDKPVAYTRNRATLKAITTTDSTDKNVCRYSLSSGSVRYDLLDQWYLTWGMRTPGGTQRHLTGYAKLQKK
jgi:hypothetical protein